ncbi:hypothetical protein CPB84DRAFT_1761633 [Gymnopilus junonius]|uniref:Uncharacterized protein n=1 Tax=Gymnopilus junonius TaxID=109634 RepID=A0A9P5NZT3_GYMJU|nr:hypothetical protein CPB84DRAFT_1761633 [Gymnopilus junonius]
MATSFAAYASQYLNRQHAEASVASSQPMFFSFTTDDEGSRRGGHDTDLDDLDDPHLNLSMGTNVGASGHRQEGPQDDEDPYLRLDEDEHTAGGSRTIFRHQQEQQNIPLMARSASPDSPPGWLAHLARSPPRRPSPSPPPSESSESDSTPPMDLLVTSPQGQPRAPNTLSNNAARPPSIPPPPRTEPRSLSLSLTDSLLPSRPQFTFTLPDPRHTSRKRRKYHDSIWTTVFLALLSACLVFSLLVLFFTKRPKGVPAVVLPYAIMLRTVPILVILTCVSAVIAYTHVYLLRLFVGPVMIATEVFVPATLFICAVWAFVGSFMWEAGVEPTWGETVGLRLFSLIPLVLSLLTARRLINLPRQIHTTSSLLTLSTHILMGNPFLLALSPLLLILMLLLSIPFITLTFRLLLIGYTTGVKEKGTMEWHVRAWADWAIVGVMVVWIWAWAVARGVLRTTAASVVGAWYFADPSIPPPPPSSTHTIHAALTRSTGPSLGSVILASLILTALRLLTLLILLLNRLPPLLLRIPWVPLAVPVGMYIVPGIRVLRVSAYALVFVGLGGVGFWEGAGRGVGLVSGRSEREREQGQGQPTNAGRTRGRKGQHRQQPNPNPIGTSLKKARFTAEPPLTLLTISPLTLTLPSSLLVYLFVAHTLSAPNEALGAALLAGGMTAIVGLFCTGLVRDVVDALWVCWCVNTRKMELDIVFGDGSERREVARDTVIIPRSPLSRRDEGTSRARGLEASAVGVGVGVLFDEEETTSEESERGQNRKKGKGKERASRKPPELQTQPHQTQTVAPYQIGDDSDLESELGTVETARAVQIPGRPIAQEQEEEDDPLDPFKTSRHVDEEALIEGLGARSSRVNSRVGSAGTSPTFGTGTTPTTATGLRQGPPFTNRNLANMNFGVGAGLGKGVTISPGAFGAFPVISPGVGGGGHVKSPSGGSSAVGQGHGQRMMTSTQELNMKSQFLMNMRGGGAGSGVGSVDGSRVSDYSGHVGGEEEEEEEGSVLGPGSGFFE